MARKKSESQVEGATEQTAAVEAEQVPETISQAVSEGATAAKQSAAVILPAFGKFLGKTVYGGCYYAAYGVTFAALTAAKIIPMDNAVTHGIHDGAAAAATDLHKSEVHAEEAAQPEEGAVPA
ncbi:MAG: hypothetical protein P8Y64_11545 [Gammaproteobacteria bacterium]